MDSHIGSPYKTNALLGFWQKNSATFVFIVLLAIFFTYSIFLALNLSTGYIPDEDYRFKVSQYFAKTGYIPDDVPITRSSGEEQHRNPFMGYWIFGRALNLISLVIPNASDHQNLVGLRMVNSLFALGTVIFTYLISKEIIKNKWLRLLPVFMLTNTLMFVFLAGGVSYDNPTNFFCTLGIYFFIRTLKKKPFIINSLAWITSIAFGALIKHTVLPLAAVMFVIWVIYIIKNRGTITLQELNKNRFAVYALAVLLLVIVGLNIYLYGVNLIKYHSLKPSCYDTFSQEICDQSVFVIRAKELGLPQKLTLVEAFKQGYPDPIRFTFDIWIREMLKRIFGIMGGVDDYFPINIAYFHIAFYWILVLASRYLRKISPIIKNLFFIFSFYVVVLIYTNYNSELAYGFYKYVALQGRYLFPVISIAFILCTFILEQVKNKFLRLGTTLALVLLFLYSGPIRFFWYHDSVFANWFI
jgi:hypothetical protein